MNEIILSSEEESALFCNVVKHLQRAMLAEVDIKHCAEQKNDMAGVNYSAFVSVFRFF